jgi:hypothetical protein
MVQAPKPSPQGGGEHTERAALFCVHFTGIRSEVRYPRLSMKRGAFTLASNSRAMVPAGCTEIFGVTWKV